MIIPNGLKLTVACDNFPCVRGGRIVNSGIREGTRITVEAIRPCDDADLGIVFTHEGEKCVALSRYFDEAHQPE